MVGKDSNLYDAEGSDTTMLNIASLPEQHRQLYSNKKRESV